MLKKLEYLHEEITSNNKIMHYYEQLTRVYNYKTKDKFDLVLEVTRDIKNDAIIKYLKTR
jgi:hypothetical protein